MGLKLSPYQRSKQKLLLQHKTQYQRTSCQPSRVSGGTPNSTPQTVSGHSKDKQRAIKELGRKTRVTREWYEVGLLWLEDEVKLPNNFYAAMVQLKSLERRLQKQDTLLKHYQKTLTLTSKQFTSAQLNEMNRIQPETSFSDACHIILSSTRIKPNTLQKCGRQRQSIVLRGSLQRQISI